MNSSVSTHDSRRSTRATIRAVVLLSIVLTAVFVVSFVFSEEGIAQLQQSRKRVGDLQRNIDRLRVENDQLSARITSVKQSTYAIERIAREDLGMSRPGEVVYMLPAKKPVPPPPPAPVQP